MFSITKGLTVGVFVALLAPAAAAPTPVPGGANGISAVAGKLGQTVFNGVLRIKVVALREATDADHADMKARDSDFTATAGKKAFFLESLLRNGTHDEFNGYMVYTLADKDDVSVAFPTSALKNASPHMLQGAAMRQSGGVLVDSDFVPVKLIVTCASCPGQMGFRPVRFTIPAH